MKTLFTKLLSIDYPIMQAPIGGAAGPELASSVSNAGALGSLAVWPGPATQSAPLVKAAMGQTSKPFAVNIRADLNQVDHIAAALDTGATIIHLFWGSPAPFVDAIHGAGAKVFCTVASGEEATRALDAGADVLIAQGWEAGGHVSGTISTMALIPTVADLAGTVPVLAAGGISSGRGLAAALMLGASGAVMGTRFVASLESRAHPAYKEALTKATQADAVYVENLFHVGWPNAPHRVLRNSTVRAWEEAGRPPVGSRPDESATVAYRPDGSPITRYSVPQPLLGTTGNLESLALYAGQGVEQVRDILPAARIVDMIMQEARARLTQAYA